MEGEGLMTRSCFARVTKSVQKRILDRSGGKVDQSWTDSYASRQIPGNDDIGNRFRYCARS